MFRLFVFAFVILCAGIVSAQCTCYYVQPTHYYYYPQPVYYAQPTYYYPQPYYYSQPRYYDYGSGRYISASERAWLDRRAEAIFTGGPGSPLWMRGLRLWVNMQ